MTSAEFRTVIAALGLSQIGAARLFGRTTRSVQRWVAGDRTIPPEAAILVRLMQTGKITPDDVRGQDNESYYFSRRFPDGTTRRLGTAVRYADGWRFLSNDTAHKSSRKGHPTMERCLPRWVGYPSLDDSIIWLYLRDGYLGRDP